MQIRFIEALKHHVGDDNKCAVADAHTHEGENIAKNDRCLNGPNECIDGVVAGLALKQDQFVPKKLPKYTECTGTRKKFLSVHGNFAEFRFGLTVATIALKKAGRANRSFSEGWLRGLDLNQRPLGYEPNELPGCSTPRHLEI